MREARLYAIQKGAGARLPTHAECPRLIVEEERHEGVCGMDGKGGCPEARPHKKGKGGKEMVREFFCFG
jgi:hypothetical protein